MRQVAHSGILIRCAPILIASAVVHSAASACGGDYNSVGFLHSSLPNDTEYEVAAKVEITSVSGTRFPAQAEARILSMIRGDYAGSKIVIQNIGGTSCDVFPVPGEQGIVMGTIIPSSGDALVINPIRTLSERQVFLKTGKVPE